MYLRRSFGFVRRARLEHTGRFIAIGMSVLTLVAGVSAQRLCEHNDNPVAKIAPCTGPAGTAITVTRVRTSVPAAKSLVFTRMVANATPAKVTIPVSNGKATAPQQLCVNGPGRWEVWLVDGNGRDQGKIGAFWPECGGSSTPSGGSGPGGGNPSGGPGGGPTPGPGGEPGGGGGGGAAVIDKCLVGTWVSGPVGGKMTGGKGMRLTFKADRTQIADYSNMEVLKLNTIEYQYAGSSIGKISTSAGTAKNVRTGGDSTLASKMDFQGGPPKPSPGPALGMNKNKNGYKCTENTLQFEQEDFNGNPWISFTMSRVK